MAPSRFWSSLDSIGYSGVEPKNRSSEDKLLNNGDGDSSDSRCHMCGTDCSKKSMWRWKAAIILLGSFALLLALILFIKSQLLSLNGIPTIYSPVESAVEYEALVFLPNPYEDHTPYAGPPTESVDEMWDMLYGGISNVRIDKSSAERLPNQTLLIPGEDKYVIGIEVFHQLHCLDTMRKALYPERYKAREGLTAKQLFKYETHLAHCVEVLRHAVQCYSDTTAIPWAWNAERNMGLPTAHTMHICRNFGKIQDWARERAFKEGEFAASVAAQKEKLANGF